MIDFVDLVRLEAELQRAYDEGYADGKRDAASPWYRVEEPPKYSGKVFVLLNRESPFYDTELVADTAMYNCLPHGPVPVGTFYKGMFGKSDFEDITKNVLYWMPVELPKEKKI